MAQNFCTYCGGRLGAGANFCHSCGKSVPAGNLSVPAPDLKGLHDFTPRPHPFVAAFKETPEQDQAGKALAAAEAAGSDALPPDAGPARFLAFSIHRLLNSTLALFKNPRQLTALAIVLGSWLILSLLPVFSIRHPVLETLAFAQGGLGAGWSGVIGGSVGRAVIAFFLFKLILPSISGQKINLGIGQGFRRVVQLVKFSQMETSGQLLCGIGSALIAYNWMAGRAVLANSLVALVSGLISLGALSSQSSFLRGLLESFSARRASKRPGVRQPQAVSPIDRFLAGWGAGFMVALLVSIPGIAGLAYLTGALCLAAAGALLIAGRSGRKAVA